LGERRAGVVFISSKSVRVGDHVRIANGLRALVGKAGRKEWADAVVFLQ